ncbi:MAG: hypothetical protein CEN87_166 [Parcubacteria group bacterium Licking1014_1]|nr:MAG: hypothetical protein CEN87_166 [Parcubacteria group bacterium Licking1014_1]
MAEINKAEEEPTPEKKELIPPESEKEPILSEKEPVLEERGEFNYEQRRKEIEKKFNDRTKKHAELVIEIFLAGIEKSHSTHEEKANALLSFTKTLTEARRKQRDQKNTEAGEPASGFSEKERLALALGEKTEEILGELIVERQKLDKEKQQYIKEQEEKIIAEKREKRITETEKRIGEI